MPRVQKFPCEVRFNVSEEIHEWLKSTSYERGYAIGTFVRDLVIDEMHKDSRRIVCRSTDPLIEAIAEKLGVELPKKESENSYQLEDKNRTEKEGKIQEK